LTVPSITKQRNASHFFGLHFSAVSYVFVRFFYDSSGKPIITRVPVPSCDVIVKLCPSFFKIVLQRYSPIPVEKQVIIIYAVVSGALLDIPANQIGEFEKELFSFVDSVYSDIPESIRTTGKLEDDVKEKLTKAIEECKSKFLSEH